MAALGAGTYRLFSPKIGRATKAEIMAALPAALKKTDVADPTGEARYGRLTALAASIDKEPLETTGTTKGLSTAANEAVLRRIEGLLAEGGVRVPARSEGFVVTEATPLRNAAKAVALAAEAARKRGDRASCARWCALGLRYGAALDGSGGVLIDRLVGLAIDAIALRATYLAEIEGGLDDPGRTRLLALLTPQDGTSPAMAEALRRDFQVGWLPLLLDPPSHRKELAEVSVGLGNWMDEGKAHEVIGTFDPVASARLAGGIYAATMDDLRRPFAKKRHEATRLAEEAAEGLPDAHSYPDLSTSAGDLWARFKYRAAMNGGTNTLGRRYAVEVTILDVDSAAVRSAALNNLVRAAILRRMGRPAAVRDPFGTGGLRFDSKRKLVWSVGADGRDDGGAIGRGWDNNSSDFGLPYGDGSYPMKPPPGGRLGYPAAPPGVAVLGSP